jgi:hypothetical protein
MERHLWTPQNVYYGSGQVRHKIKIPQISPKKFDFNNKGGMIRVSGRGKNRVYVLRNRTHIGAAVAGANAAVCLCGTIYSWTGIEPACPGCGQRNIKQYFDRTRNAYLYEDGVYVDISCKDDKITLGFAVVEDSQAQLMSCPSESGNSTVKAEHEAVAVARKLWPGKQVYCDFSPACARGKAKFVPRERNHLAHKAAKFKIGYSDDPTDSHGEDIGIPQGTSASHNPSRERDGTRGCAEANQDSARSP